MALKTLHPEKIAYGEQVRCVFKLSVSICVFVQISSGLSFFDQSKSFLYSSFKLQEAVLFVGHASASFLGLIFFYSRDGLCRKGGTTCSLMWLYT